VVSFMPVNDELMQRAVTLLRRYRAVPKDIFEHVVNGGRDLTPWFEREEFKTASVRYLHKKNNGALPGGVSWLCCSESHLSDQTLHQALAVAWACLAERERVYKVEPSEVRSLIGDQGVPGNVSYVIGKEVGELVVWRCYICMRNVLGAIEQVRKSLTVTDSGAGDLSGDSLPTNRPATSSPASWRDRDAGSAVPPGSASRRCVAPLLEATAGSCTAAPRPARDDHTPLSTHAHAGHPRRTDASRA
jgi:hypothetical protein